MKRYKSPYIKFCKVSNKNIFTTSIPTIYEEDADNSQVLSPEREQDWGNW